MDPNDASARSAAGRLLAARSAQRRTRRRPSEDLRVVVPVDARTKAGRAARDLKAALLRHAGPRPSAAGLALIQQLIQLKLRLVLLDQRFLEAAGSMSPHDSRQYLAWSNSFVRGLKALGLDGAPEAPITLAEALAAGAPQARLGGSAVTAGVSHAAPAGPFSAARSPAPAL